MRTLPAPLLLWIAALCGFVVLAAFASIYDRFPADLWLVRRFQDVDSSAFARTLNWAADAASGWEPLVVVTGGALFLLLVRRRLPALLLALAPVAGLLNAAVKEIVDRPRPGHELVPWSTRSYSSAFPSGHAESAIVIYGLLFYFITIFITQPAVRLVGQAACLWVILFTGMQRVYTGVHWPSDVLGGYYLGGLVLAALIGLHRYLSRAVVTDRSRSRY
jgi:undecaprenyl-diphosphatase